MNWIMEILQPMGIMPVCEIVKTSAVSHLVDGVNCLNILMTCLPHKILCVLTNVDHWFQIALKWRFC